jgi:hypothetical protein
MALKVVYPICCGIDVHQTFVVAFIASINDKEFLQTQSLCYLYQRVKRAVTMAL